MLRHKTNSWMQMLPGCLLIPALALIGIRANANSTGDEHGQRRPQKKQHEQEELKKPEKMKRTPVRWGKRRSETDEQYDKRYANMVKKVKEDTLNNTDAADVKMWTIMGHPFIVRSDIDAEFTADTAMYMEMLHREYGQAYAKLLGGVPSNIKEPIEVVVFNDRTVYFGKAHGPAGSGGVFMQYGEHWTDRAPSWPSSHFRLMQFTDGVTDFARWPKGVLKHEASHMELQMRLGLLVDTPRWFNEGHATVFEYWDFSKTVQENFALIPTRGRYAPVIRRLFGTDEWKPFSYVWTVDREKWMQDMTSPQGFLNYSESWALAGYMMNEGNKGRADFRKIFNLSGRVGSGAPKRPQGPRRPNRKGPGTGPGSAGGSSGEGGSGSKAWDDAFPKADRDKLDANWTEWVKSNLPKDKMNKDEIEMMMTETGFDPDTKDKLAPRPPQVEAKYRKVLKDAQKGKKPEDLIQR